MPPKSKKAAGERNGTESAPIDVEADEHAAAPGGIADYELPRSRVLRIAKAAVLPLPKSRMKVPANVKMQKEIAPAIVRGSSVFISYLATLAHEVASARGVKTITAEDVLNSLDELDWGEGETAAIRKDLKKNLRAFRANATAKKEGKPLPCPAGSAVPAQISKSTVATPMEEEEDGSQEIRAAAPFTSSKSKGKQRAGLGDDEEEADDLVEEEEEAEEEDQEDDSNVRRLKDDRERETDGEESPYDTEGVEDDDEDVADEEEDEEEGPDAIDVPEDLDGVEAAMDLDSGGEGPDEDD